MIGVKVKIVVFFIFLINLFSVPSVAFAKGGRGGGIGEGIVSFGSSGFQINDPVMFFLYISLGIILVSGMLSAYIRLYRVKRKVKAFEENEQRSYESSNLKNIENHKDYGNDPNNGYLVCKECNGYYKLKKGEYTQDFDMCHCGGNLIYYNNVDEFR